MKDIIQQRMDRYGSTSEQDEENALKEAAQEVLLYALAKANFFEKAAFQGGTALRIVHQLDRFSEDLDFALHRVDLDFNVKTYLDQAAKTMNSYGFEMSISGTEKQESNLRKHFLKDESIKKILRFKHLTHLKKKISIKVELDLNPPAGAETEIKFLDFPVDFSISTHDLPSLFAGKTHAVLCRTYVKGRDWYDFSWYLSRGIYPNLTLLQNALYQMGPWKDKKLNIDNRWLHNALQDKIEALDWSRTIKDVTPFLKPDKKEEIEKLWGKDFFLSKLEKMSSFSKKLKK